MLVGGAMGGVKEKTIAGNNAEHAFLPASGQGILDLALVVAVMAVSRARNVQLAL